MSRPEGGFFDSMSQSRIASFVAGGEVAPLVQVWRDADCDEQRAMYRALIDAHFETLLAEERSELGDFLDALVEPLGNERPVRSNFGHRRGARG